MKAPIGVLTMAYGTASGPEDVGRYYTDIRGGRPPTPGMLADLKDRYEAIGNRFPLLEITRLQARGLELALNDGRVAAAGSSYRTYLGMKHSPPLIRTGVEEMMKDGIERAVALVLAPHYSVLSVGGYVERIRAALRELGVGDGGPPRFSFVRHWYDHPAYLDVLSSRVMDALARIGPAGAEATVLFTAHSVPARIVEEGDPYPDQLRATADLVADRLGLRSYDTAWQSAGRTPEPWLGPDLTDAIREAAERDRATVVVCPCGFVADHLEVLYDIDIEAQAVAREMGIRLVRTEMMNADPRFVAALAAVVRDHLRAHPEAA